ncbi:MAG TPA: creatininase family protein [Povalibacter sp.]|nr:creatininase family protein [Povalibacter sp.]
MSRIIRALLSTLALGACLCAAAPASARSWNVAEMNTEQLRALDHSRTVVLLPGGILEEHGPYLPSNTDGIVSERQTRDLADALVERGWEVLIFPLLPLGAGGANELAAKYPFPGTYVVRLETLRAVYMDWADELGEAGFKRIFILNSHGAPNHNRILDQACTYFNDTYHGRMLHVTGGFGVYTAPDNPRNTLSATAKQEDADSGHAGIDETSLLLFLRPDLVNPDYEKAPVFTAAGENGMVDVAKRKDWRGYFGAPRYASAEYGAKLYELTMGFMVKEALDALEAPLGKAVTARSRPLRNVDDAAIARDSTIKKRQQDWLEKNGQH